MKYLYDDIDVDKPGDLGFEAEAVHNTITSLMDRLRWFDYFFLPVSSHSHGTFMIFNSDFHCFKPVFYFLLCFPLFVSCISFFCFFGLSEDDAYVDKLPTFGRHSDSFTGIVKIHVVQLMDVQIIRHWRLVSTSMTSVRDTENRIFFFLSILKNRDFLHFLHFLTY